MYLMSCLAAALSGSVFSIESGKSTGIKFPPTASLSCFQAAADGQLASEGSMRGPPSRAFTRLRLAPFDTAVVLTREEKPGTSPTGRMVLRDKAIAMKLCKLLNQRGVGKSFADIGSLEVDDEPECRIDGFEALSRARWRMSC